MKFIVCSWLCGVTTIKSTDVQLELSFTWKFLEFVVWTASFRWPSIFLTHLGLTFLLIIIQKSGKYVAKGPMKHLEVLINELDKMAIKLNYIIIYLERGCLTLSAPEFFLRTSATTPNFFLTWRWHRWIWSKVRLNWIYSDKKWFYKKMLQIKTVEQNMLFLMVFYFNRSPVTAMILKSNRSGFLMIHKQ